MNDASHLTTVSNRRHKKFLTQPPLGSGLQGQMSQLSSDILSQNVCSSSFASDRCALHSSSAEECGGVMGHIEEHLLRVATTKGSPNQIAALRSLKLLIKNDPNCIRHLLRFNILDALVKVLQQPYKKNLWELMNSYIWSGSSLENLHLKMMRDTVIDTLIMLAQRNETIRSRMATDEHFKSLLMRIYLCEMKGKKNKGMSSAIFGKANGMSKQVGKADAGTVSNVTQDTSTNRLDSSGDKNNDDAIPSNHNENHATSNSMAHKDDHMSHTEGDARCDTQVLLRDLFHSFGYTINDDSVMERYERAIEGSEANDTTLCDTGGLVEHCDGPDDAQASMKSEDTSHVSADELNARQEADQSKPDTTIIWIPYAFRRKNQDAIDAIKRHLRINLGDVEVVENMDALENVTIDSTDDALGDMVFGMVALSSHRCPPQGPTDRGFNYAYAINAAPFTAEIPTNKQLRTKKGCWYSVISNIQVTTSEHLNGQTVAANLLRKLHTTSSLEVLSDIIRELWILVGSKDKHVLEVIHRDLDLERLADIVNKTLVHKPDVKHVIESKVKHARNTLYRILDNWGRKLGSYIASVLPTLSGSAEQTTNSNCIGGASKDKPHPNAILSSNKTNVEAGAISDTVEPTGNIEATETIAMQLQSAIFGLLIDMIYLNGHPSLSAIRECLPLVEALKKARAGLPDLLRFVDVIDNNYDDFCPILDKRRNDALNDTAVIYGESGCESDQYNASDLRSRERDEFGNIISNTAVWTDESWMRQKCTNKAALGALFNCHKLLNILGHHEQHRFKHRGLRILSIDGGGSKGVIALEILKELENTLGKPLHEAFDIICGTSCGGLVGAFLALEKARVSDIQTLFELMMARIFMRDSYRVTGTRLIMRQAYYDETVLYESLRKCFGELEMIDYSVDPSCPKFFCLSVQMDVTPMKPIVWRNYNYPPEACVIPECDNHTPPRDGSFAIHVADAIRATTAAPMYFPLLERNGNLFGDGALHANNPSLIAMLEANLIYPNVPIDCIVSVGTGRTTQELEKRKTDIDLGTESKRVCTGDSGNATESKTDSSDESNTVASELESPDDESQSKMFDIKDFLLRSLSMPASNDPKSLGLDQLINHVISSATSSEGVHTALQTLMDSNKYFRFNPPIPSVRLDDTNPEVLGSLKAKTRRYLNEERQRKRMDRIGNLFKRGT